MKFVIGFRKAGIVQTNEYDGRERETHVHLQKLLGDSTIDALFVRRGKAGDPVYLRGEPQKHANS